MSGILPNDALMGSFWTTFEAMSDHHVMFDPTILRVLLPPSLPAFWDITPLCLLFRRLLSLPICSPARPLVDMLVVTLFLAVVALAVEDVVVLVVA